MSFFQGTLQEGIAAAVQQSKSVVCFVADNEAESVKWQDEYLTDDTVAPILTSDAVVLRLESGSQEEGFLTQLYPIPMKPTVVVIKNAELREYIASGVSKDDFLRRLRQSLQPPPPPAPVPGPSQTEQLIPPAPASLPTPAAPAASAAPAAPAAADTESASSTSSGRATPTSTAANEAQVQSLLAERAARLTAQKKKDEEEAKKRRVEKRKAEAESIAAGKAPDAQTKHAETLKKKQRAAREERERILKAIEDDKAARKARQAEKDALRRASEATASAAEAKGVPDTESASSTSSGRATPTSTAANEAQMQSLLAERAARLAAQKKNDEEEAKKRRIEKGKAKAESIAAGNAPDTQTKYAETHKEKQRVAREERERVLKAIEDDKAARKARQAEKDALRRASEAAAEAEAKGVPLAPASQLYPSTGRIHENCALQVRLLDGSTIRSRFSSRDTLKDVRQWVDDTAQLGKTPYTFKILMTPLPSVKLDVTEEGKQLQELGLTPSATLILLPVVRRRFAAAYDDAPLPGNIFMRFLARIVAFISGFFGVILSFIATMFSTAGAPPPSVDNPSSQGPASGRDSGQNSDARQRRNEQQFYNGNSTNFQPRVDDEEEEFDN